MTVEELTTIRNVILEGYLVVCGIYIAYKTIIFIKDSIKDFVENEPKKKY